MAEKITTKAIIPGPVCTFDIDEYSFDSVVLSHFALTTKFSCTTAQLERKRV